jgi:PAS domain S-box-containing protein
MDRPDPGRVMGLSPAEERWARRLSQVQGARDELVRLLGLLRILGSIATRSEGLEEGAEAITRHLVNYLGLEYCGFYVRLGGVEALKASHGQTPSPEVSALLGEKVATGSTFAGRLDQGEEQSQLACLPLLGASERLGGLAMILGHALDPRQRRHLTMVAEAVAPVLETFLLRGRLQDFNHTLRQETRRATQSLAELDRAHQEAEACLGGLLAVDPEPLFVVDPGGCLQRLNPALESLLGWSRDHLLGRRLADFFARPADWEQVSHWLEQGQEEVACELPLLVQCGTVLPARLCLRQFSRGGQLAGTMGRLTRVPETAPQASGWLAAQEVEELTRLCGEAGNRVNNLLAALRAHLQLALLQDMDPELRQRLELLEDLAEDSKGVTRQAQEFVEHLRQKCRTAAARGQLWPSEQAAPASPEGPDPGPPSPARQT